MINAAAATSLQPKFPEMATDWSRYGWEKVVGKRQPSETGVLLNICYCKNILRRDYVLLEF